MRKVAKKKKRESCDGNIIAKSEAIGGDASGHRRIRTGEGAGQSSWMRCDGYEYNDEIDCNCNFAIALDVHFLEEEVRSRSISSNRFQILSLLLLLLIIVYEPSWELNWREARPNLTACKGTRRRGNHETETHICD